MYLNTILPEMREQFQYANVMQVPKLEKIVVNDLKNHTFYAKLVLRSRGEVIEIDSRPSDAIALGVASDTAIFVNEHVLREVCQ